MPQMKCSTFSCIALSTAAYSFALRATQRRSLSSFFHGSLPGRCPVNAQADCLPFTLHSPSFFIIEHLFLIVKRFSKNDTDDSWAGTRKTVNGAYRYRCAPLLMPL